MKSANVLKSFCSLFRWHRPRKERKRRGVQPSTRLWQESIPSTSTSASMECMYSSEWSMRCSCEWPFCHPFLATRWKEMPTSFVQTVRLSRILRNVPLAGVSREGLRGPSRKSASSPWRRWALLTFASILASTKQCGAKAWGEMLLITINLSTAPAGFHDP